MENGANPVCEPPRPRSLQVERVTVYQMRCFGAAHIEAAALELLVNPASIVHAKVRKPRARKWEALSLERQSTIVVLEGWGHPAQPQFVKTPDGRGESTRFASFDPEWQADFDRFMARYLAENPSVVVLGDYRGVERAACLRAAG